MLAIVMTGLFGTMGLLGVAMIAITVFDRRLGPVVAKLRRSAEDWELLVGGMCFGAMAIEAGARIVVSGCGYSSLQPSATKYWLPFVTLVCCGVLCVCTVFVGMKGSTLRHRGIVCAGKLIPWGRISGWSWEDGDPCTLRIDARAGFRTIFGRYLWGGVYSGTFPQSVKGKIIAVIESGGAATLAVVDRAYPEDPRVDTAS